MKVVINSCFGGFGLSPIAEVEYAKRSGFSIYRYVQTKYTHRDGKNLFERIDSICDGHLISHTYTKNHGDSFSDYPDDESYWSSRYIDRNDPILVAVVEDLGKKANGYCAELSVIEIPDGVSWEIEEYDGLEHISESHRVWG